MRTKNGPYSRGTLVSQSFIYRVIRQREPAQRDSAPLGVSHIQRPEIFERYWPNIFAICIENLQAVAVIVSRALDLATLLIQLPIVAVDDKLLAIRRPAGGAIGGRPHRPVGFQHFSRTRA